MNDSPNTDIVQAIQSIASALVNPPGSTWLAWTPTVTAGSGAFGSASATGRYTKIGNTIMYRLDVTVASIGTGTGCVFSLPVTAAFTTGHIGSAREDATSGNAGTVKLNSSNVQGSVSRYDNGNIVSGGSGSVVRISGMYECV